MEIFRILLPLSFCMYGTHFSLISSLLNNYVLNLWL